MAVLFLGLRHAAFQWRGKHLQVRQGRSGIRPQGEGRVKAPMLTWDANDPNIIKVSGGSVNMYGQPGRTVITFTADANPMTSPGYWAPTN